MTTARVLLILACLCAIGAVILCAIAGPPGVTQ